MLGSRCRWCRPIRRRRRVSDCRILWRSHARPFVCKACFGWCQTYPDRQFAPGRIQTSPGQQALGRRCEYPQNRSAPGVAGIRSLLSLNLCPRSLISIKAVLGAAPFVLMASKQSSFLLVHPAPGWSRQVVAAEAEVVQLGSRSAGTILPSWTSAALGVRVLVRSYLGRPWRLLRSFPPCPSSY